jgi:hypothetical protein
VVLQEINPEYPLNHHHDLCGIPTTVKSCPWDTDDLMKYVVKHRELLLLHIELDKVPLILRTSGGVSNPGSQGRTEKSVNSVQLWPEVQHLEHT